MKWTRQQVPCQEGRLAIVTGANSGIGFETAKALAEEGARVILACRDPGRAAEAREKILSASPEARVEIGLVDLASLSSISNFCRRVLSSEDKLDLLINNAGVMMPKTRCETRDGFELQIGVNHLAHFSLSAQLLPLLVKTPGARIVSVSSLAHYKGRIFLSDLHYTSRSYWRIGSYGQSKLANLLFSLELDRRLKAVGASLLSTCAHPGWSATHLQRNLVGGKVFNTLLAMSPQQGALPTLRAACDPECTGGEYFGPKGITGTRGYPVRVGCSKAARDRSLASELWTLSEEMTGQSMMMARG